MKHNRFSQRGRESLLTQQAKLHNSSRDGRAPEHYAPEAPDASQAEEAVLEDSKDSQDPECHSAKSDACALSHAAAASDLNSNEPRV